MFGRLATLAHGLRVLVEALLYANSVISWRRSNSLASGAKRTLSEPRLQNRIYEYVP
jgi:hypothetical protein